MDFNYGDILHLETAEMGYALYMVINPPIECEHCGARLEDWEPDEFGDVYCPSCEKEITALNRVTCSCGRHDMVSVIVVTNNNFHESVDGVVPYEHKMNAVYSFCKKSLEEDILQGRIKKCSGAEAVQRKRLLEWTHSDDYDETQEMPQWIKDKYLME